MELTTREQQDLKKLLKDKQRPGMILWIEDDAHGGGTSTGYVQGNPIEMAMMAMQAIDFVAKAAGMKSEEVALKLAQMFSQKE